MWTTGSPCTSQISGLVDRHERPVAARLPGRRHRVAARQVQDEVDRLRVVLQRDLVARPAALDRGQVERVVPRDAGEHGRVDRVAPQVQAPARVVAGGPEVVHDRGGERRRGDLDRPHGARDGGAVRLGQRRPVRDGGAGRQPGQVVGDRVRGRRAVLPRSPPSRRRRRCARTRPRASRAPGRRTAAAARCRAGASPRAARPRSARAPGRPPWPPRCGACAARRRARSRGTRPRCPRAGRRRRGTRGRARCRRCRSAASRRARCGPRTRPRRTSRRRRRRGPAIRPFDAAAGSGLRQRDRRRPLRARDPAGERVDHRGERRDGHAQPPLRVAAQRRRPVAVDPVEQPARRPGRDRRGLRGRRRC